MLRMNLIWTDILSNRFTTRWGGRMDDARWLLPKRGKNAAFFEHQNKLFSASLFCSFGNESENRIKKQG